MHAHTATGNANRKSVVIVPLENLDLAPFRDSLEAASILLGLEPIFHSDPILLPSDATPLERQRKQKEAKALIANSHDALKQLDEQWRLALLVTHFDLFVNGLNFVFGLANPQEGIAVVSTARLSQWEEGMTPSKIKERILKEAAHEMGHLGKLAHCSNATCLMSYSESIDMVDAKLPLLCSACKRNLRTDGR